MKKLNINKIKTVLKNLDANDTQTELILINVYMLNDLISNYIKGENKSIYLTYQLNVQISKQLVELKKMQMKQGEDEEPCKLNEIISIVRNKGK